MAVTWYVEGAQGGDATFGTIDTSGNYTGTRQRAIACNHHHRGGFAGGLDRHRHRVSNNCRGAHRTTACSPNRFPGRNGNVFAFLERKDRNSQPANHTFLFAELVAIRGNMRLFAEWDHHHDDYAERHRGGSVYSRGDGAIAGSVIAQAEPTVARAADYVLLSFRWLEFFCWAKNHATSDGSG